MAVTLILILYAIIVVIYVVTSFFIIYHLSTYSLNLEIRTAMLIFFIIVSTGLLFSNILIFFSTDWNLLISKLIF